MKYLVHIATGNRLRKCEDGSITIFALMFVLIFIAMGGVAIDFNKAISERTQLQVAADTAAHAALYTREFQGAQQSKSVAVNTVSAMLPENQFGNNALIEGDVTFGTWDPDLLAFTADADSRSAVRVFAQASSDRGNASRNLLLNIVGQDTFDIGVVSVYSTYYPTCLTEGLVAEELVHIRSNNSFFNGFCIHSNAYVSMSQNNYFEPGTVVSMPDTSRLDTPGSSTSGNPGLRDALQASKYRIRLLRKVPGIIDSFWLGSTENTPDYITSTLMADIAAHPDFDNTGKVDPTMFAPNTINYLTCTGGDRVTFTGGVYSSFVFVTDCTVKFGEGTVLEDTVIATTNTAVDSFNTPAGFQLGRNDDCAPGGGAQLLTLGGFHTAAKIEVYNGQILAMGDIQFAAGANGIKGLSFVSKGTISGTSNMEMAYCDGEGMEDAYRAAYFRTVQ